MKSKSAKKSPPRIEDDVSESISKMFADIQKIIPEKMLDELLSLGDFLEQIGWKTGWLANEVYERVSAAQLPYDQMTVCWMISTFYLKGHLSANTVRAYMGLARSYPLEIAKAFHYDTLPMSAFITADALHGQIGKDGQPIQREDVLTWAYEEYLDSGTGKVPSKKKIEKNFLPQGDGTTATSASVTRGDALPVPLSNDPRDYSASTTPEKQTIMQNLVTAIQVVSSCIPMVVKISQPAASVLSRISLELRDLLDKMKAAPPKTTP